jgi:glucuronokinase
MITKAHAYPRAALIGNLSDGYFGKTIAFTFPNYRAELH